MEFIMRFFTALVCGFSICLSYKEGYNSYLLNCIIFVSSIFLHFSISRRLKIGFLIVELIIIIYTGSSLLEFTQMEILLHFTLFLIRLFSYHYHINLDFKRYSFLDFFFKCLFSSGFKGLVFFSSRIPLFLSKFKKCMRGFWILRVFTFLNFSYFFVSLDFIYKIIYNFYYYFLKYFKGGGRRK